jgi:hypothetical protein
MAYLILQRKQGTTESTDNYTESFTSQTSVIATHNLGYRPIVRVFNDSNEEMLPDSIIHNSTNQVTVTFTEATSGTIFMV